MTEASDLDDFHALAWDRMMVAAGDRDGPARLVVLATSAQSGPEARIVILRGVDRANMTVTLWTNALSGKADQLRADPRAALVFWDAEVAMQVRLRVHVTFEPSSTDMWEDISAATRGNYAVDPAPGTPLLSPAEASEPTVGAEAFAILTCHVRETEVLTLATAPHRRALFSPGRAIWLAP